MTLFPSVVKNSSLFIKKILFLVIIAQIFLSGCSLIADNQPKVIFENTKKELLNLPDPKPINLNQIGWLVITEKNFPEILKMLKTQNQNSVIIGLSANDYKKLTLNIAELKRFIIEERYILSSYRRYYEEEKDKKIQESEKKKK